jgi:hypothetical protein
MWFARRSNGRPRPLDEIRLQRATQADMTAIGAELVASTTARVHLRRKDFLQRVHEPITLLVSTDRDAQELVDTSLPEMAHDDFALTQLLR